MRGYKTWIAGQLEPAGRLTVDAGAVGALLSRQVAAAGRRQAGQRQFLARRYGGDPVDPDGREIARGLVAYDAADAVKIAGLKSAEIAPVLGYAARSAMVHRDDLVMSHASGEARPRQARKDRPC